MHMSQENYRTQVLYIGHEEIQVNLIWNVLTQRWTLSTNNASELQTPAIFFWLTKCNGFKASALQRYVTKACNPHPPHKPSLSFQPEQQAQSRISEACYQESDSKKPTPSKGINDGQDHVISLCINNAKTTMPPKAIKLRVSTLLLPGSPTTFFLF